jgi:hypothetical protein
MKTLYSLSICIYHSSGICTPIAANMQIRLTDKQIADAITSLERQSLRDKMAHWGDELNEERLSVYLEEGINQMVGDIPRPLFI